MKSLTKDTHQPILYCSIDIAKAAADGSPDLKQ